MTQASNPTCTIEFRVHDPQRYSLLERFFQPLRDYTRNIEPQVPQAQDDITVVGRGQLMSAFSESTATAEETQGKRQFAKAEEWLLALRPQDLEELNMPAHREAIEAVREWQGLTRRERRKVIKTKDNSTLLRNLADFTDMLRYWQEVEYVLISLEQTDPDKARIHYSAFDYPFTGKAALEELLMFFGFLSILKDTC